MRDWQRGTDGRLQRLPITRPDAKPHLGATGRRYLNASQDITDQRLQRHVDILNVHRINYA